MKPDKQAEARAQRRAQQTAHWLQGHRAWNWRWPSADGRWPSAAPKAPRVRSRRPVSIPAKGQQMVAKVRCPHCGELIEPGSGRYEIGTRESRDTTGQPTVESFATSVHEVC